MNMRKQTTYNKTKLTPRRKRELNKAVKKTVKEYHTTLKLLAKT